MCPTTTRSASEGVRLESIPINGEAQGYYSPRENKIAIRFTPSVDPLSVFKTMTLAHECAHYLTGHSGKDNRLDAETVAEASAFVTMDHFGLDTGDDSFHYVAAWAEDTARLQSNLEEIRRVSSRIIDAVEGVGDPFSDDFGNWEQAGDGPLTREILRMEEEMDRHASNL